MTFLAIMNWDGSNRVTKHSEFATEAEADTLSTLGGTLPGTDAGAFTAEHPGGATGDWLVNPLAEPKTLANTPSAAAIASAKVNRQAAVNALRDTKLAAGFTVTSPSGTWDASIIETGGLAMKHERYTRLDAGTARTITGVTQADPVVITYTGDNIPDGLIVRITSVSGTTEINNTIYRAKNGAAGTLEIATLGLGGVLVDGTGHTAYTSGGNINIFISTVQANKTTTRMTYANLTKVRDTIDGYLEECNIVGREHKDAIDALGTIALVNAYDITVNWPATS